MNTFIIITLVAIATVTNASTIPRNWRIVGGSEAADHQFPYQISLRVMNQHNCGGTLISRQWVLTAAHCLVGWNFDDLSVVVGTNSLSNGGTKYNVAWAKYNEDYDPFDINNDVGLVELATEVTLVPGEIETLPLNTQPIGGNEDLTLSGWGRTGYPGEIPDKLQFIKLKSLSNKDCGEKQDPFPIVDSEICTLTKAGEGACHGDSGGPLVYKGAVAGIVSWGRPCALGYPDVFTRVSSFVDWIQDTMNKN